MKFRKIWLNINGVDRVMVCNPEKDSLADVLRKIGLTGTKVGCNKGLCGACSVLLDGKVVRSCVKKVKNIPEYSKIITIEGIGSPENLHPIQQAWITYGGVQCGFCTPGFIVSAKSLLDQDLNPSRETVREWFQKHRNVCRCTGYKPLVDAVMHAAEVMRGEKSMEEIVFQMPENGKIYGSAYPRPAALAKVTGLCDYGNDIQMKMPSGTLYLAVVQPGVSHAKIKGIDFSEAEKMPGVVKVITAKDIKGTNRIIFPVGHARTLAPGMERPILSDEKVFRYGDVVAMVAADTEVHAREAAKAVKLDLEQLPEYMNYLEACMPDAERIHEEFPNLFLQTPLIKGEDVRPVIEKSEYVVEGSFYSGRQPHLVLEPETIQAYVDEEGRVTVQSKTLALGLGLMLIGPGIGLTPDKLRMIENPTGASFGCTCSPANIALAAAATIALDGEPVTLTMTYAEHQHFTGKRLPSYSNARLSADQEGRITALEYDFGWDKGAYSELAENYLGKAIRLVGWPYNIPNIRGLSRVCITNHSFGTAYRAAGAVQSFTCSEAIVDMMAEKIGMDPFEFRYKNIARPGDLTVNSYPYKEYPFEEMMDKMKPIYEDAVSRAKAKDTPEKRRGVGLAWGGFIVSGGIDHAEVALELNEDGSITHFNTWEDQGQGADVGSLMHTHEALRTYGYNISPEQIKLVQADTAQAPLTGPAAANRSHYMAGNATLDAAKQLTEAMSKSDGSFRTYDEMINEGIPTKYLGAFDTAGMLIDFDPNTGAGDPFPENNYGLFLSEVEVDSANYKTKVLSMALVYDIGTVGNIQSVEGQVYGAMSHSIGFALSEKYEDVKKHDNIAACGIPYIEDIPDELIAISHVTPRKTGPYGSTGCAEMMQSAGHMAVINAINNATGVRIYELPATPEKLKIAMEEKALGKTLVTDKYFLGSDLYDELEKIAEAPIDIKQNGPEAVAGL